MKNETFREIAATLSYPMPQTNKQRARTLTLRDNSFMTPGTEDNPNKYYYPYGIGIKTGFTNAAGYCYVGAAEKDGVELISVVLAAGQRGRWADTIKMMDYGFSQYVNVTPIDLYAMNPLPFRPPTIPFPIRTWGAWRCCANRRIPPRPRPSPLPKSRWRPWPRTCATPA